MWPFGSLTVQEGRKCFRDVRLDSQQKNHLRAQLCATAGMACRSKLLRPRTASRDYWEECVIQLIALELERVKVVMTAQVKLEVELINRRRTVKRALPKRLFILGDLYVF